MIGTIALATLATTYIVAASNTDLPPWANYGLLGVIVVAFILQQIVPGALWKAERSRADGYELLFRDKIFPLLGTSTEVLSQVVDLLKSFKTERDQQIHGQESSIRSLLEELVDANREASEQAQKPPKKSAAKTRKKRL